MKKYKIYIVAMVAAGLGVLLGWFLFHNENANAASQEHTASGKESDTQEAKEWTCSMHPQIRQGEPGDCPICGMDLIPASQASSEEEIGFQMTEEAVKLAQIQTTTIGNNTTSEEAVLRLNGKIQADETQSASLVTHIPGRIEKLFVAFTGEEVSQGQPIARIYSPDLITAQKELLEAQKIQDISPNLLSAAKNKLKYWKIGSHTIDDILQSGNIRETFTIYAEHSGIVSQKRVSVGDYLSKGEVLFDIQNLNSLWAIFDVYENDLPQVHIGHNIAFTTPSAPTTTFRATITFINPVIDPASRTASIRAEVKNPNGQLKPEMFLTGTLQSRPRTTALTVPKSAVLWTGKRSVVYVQLPDMDVPSFEYREVELGEMTPAGYQVVSGLEAGDEVVTHGAFVIDAAAQLNNQSSMMNQEVETQTGSPAPALPDYTATTPTAFKTQLGQLAEAYLMTKDALVASDTPKAATEARGILQQLKKVDMSLVKDDAHKYWMEQQQAIQTHSQKITDTEDLAQQRQQFDFLSQALIKTLQVFGVDGTTLYVQHCPMANNDEGADWLSKQQKIRNPYFGDQMLTCGLVQDSIQ